jgi:hypothetical protein
MRPAIADPLNPGELLTDVGERSIAVLLEAPDKIPDVNHRINGGCQLPRVTLHGSVIKRAGGVDRGELGRLDCEDPFDVAASNGVRQALVLRFDRGPSLLRTQEHRRSREHRAKAHPERNVKPREHLASRLVLLCDTAYRQKVARPTSLSVRPN